MPDSVEASINLLPLESAHKELAVRATRLVKSNPKAFQEAADWLEREYSEKEVTARKEAGWRRGLGRELRDLRDVIGAGEVQSRLHACSFVVPTAWRSPRGRKPFFDEQLAKSIEDQAKAVSPKHFRAIRLMRKARIKEVKAELKAGPKADRKERLTAALGYLSSRDTKVVHGNGQNEFAQKVAFVAALCVWHKGFAGMGELAAWKWNGRASLLDDPLLRRWAGESWKPDGDAELGREQVLFPAMKAAPDLYDGEVSFDSLFADRLGKAVALLESEQAKDGAGKPTDAVEGDDALLTPRQIAARLGCPEKAEAFRQKLNRQMNTHKLPDGAVIENANAGKGQARYLYRLDRVRHLLTP